MVKNQTGFHKCGLNLVTLIDLLQLDLLIELSQKSNVHFQRIKYTCIQNNIITYCH